MQDDVELVATVREGSVLAGKYRVEKVLGSGGMAVVVAAHHLQLDDRVAIKFLLPEGLRNPEAVERFDREARAAVKIKNEHVARTIDVGKLDNGAPYIVMEYLEGSDLSNILRTRGVFSIEDAVEYVLQACEAIAEAHGLGIVHRDLKPANLFLVRRADGLMAVKVLDFGISKVTGLDSSGRDMGMTKTSSVMGSPLYMSPEQMESARKVDARTDIWAIGVVLFELLTGRVPFLAESMPELVVRILTAPPDPLRTYRPDAPAGLEAVIQRCLQKDRTRRYNHIGELAVALVEFGPKRARSSADRVSRTAQAAGLSSSALSLLSFDPASSAPATVASWGRTSEGSGGGRRWVGLAGFAIVVALVLGGGAWMLTKRGSSANGPASSSAVLIAPPQAETAVVPLASSPQKNLLVASVAPPGSSAPPSSSLPHVVSKSPPIAPRPRPPLPAVPQARPGSDLGGRL